MKKLLLTVGAILAVFTHEACAQILQSSLWNTETITRYAHETGYPRYQGEVTAGWGSGSNMEWERVYIETVHGVRINKYFFAGAGAAPNYAYNWEELAVMPVFGAFRGYLPLRGGFTPYLSVDMGGSIVLSENEDIRTGFYVAFGPGFNYKHLSFGVGLQHFGLRVEEPGMYDPIKASTFQFYAKIGFVF